MSVGLCDRITEQEWVVRGPETERLWVSHVVMGDQGPATGKHKQVVVGGQRESMPPGARSG